MFRAIAFIVAALTAAMPAIADVAPDAVVWGEHGEIVASVSDAPGDPVAGAKVYSERSQGNCVACHAVSSSEAAFQGNVGPSLDGAADRWTEAQLRGIVADAKRTFPDSMMPSMYKTDGYIRPGVGFTATAATEPMDPLLKPQQIEDVVAYLMTLKE